MRQVTTRSDSGAVSLFIVIFSALLMTIITVAFVRIMIQTQQQATTTDLSKSALDSAYAGVEDAKRAIVQYKTQCAGDNATTTACVHLVDAFSAQQCNTLQAAGISGKPDDKEVQIEQSQNDEKLEQAYTCVKVQLNTQDYLGDISSGSSRLIHLKSDSPFTQVTVEWYSQQDLQEGLGSGTSNDKVNLYTDAQIPPPLPKISDWPQSRPALLRLQLLQFGKTFNLSDFNKNDNANRDNASLFLYPSSFGATTASFSDDTRQSSTSDDLKLVNCDPTFSTTGGVGAYACKMTITVPNPVGASDNSNRDAYLRVDELYNTSTNFRVTMQNGTDPVTFSAVQPAVDSTGRANDLFRRVSSRIDLEGSSVPNIEAAVDVTGSLCKTFLVTDDAADYNSGICQDASSGN